MMYKLVNQCWYKFFSVIQGYLFGSMIVISENATVNFGEYNVFWVLPEEVIESPDQMIGFRFPLSVLASGNFLAHVKSFDPKRL